MIYRIQLKKYVCRIIFFFIGCLAGLGGAIAGIAIGWVADMIIERIRDDLRRRNVADNPLSADNGNPYDSVYGNVSTPPRKITEPFCGIELVCALAVYCTGDVLIAAKHMRDCFGQFVDVDWFSLCRPSSEAESLNGDLLTECLAALVKKNPEAVPLEYVFTLLSTLEFGWNERNKGSRPSVYLAELLNQRVVSNEMADAYILLDITPDATDADVKSAHRRLVSLYHPDILECLPEQQREIARSAFMRIQQAYELISAERKL